MIKRLVNGFALSLLGLLSACGGGGDSGGGSGGNGAPGNGVYNLAFTPATLSGSLFKGPSRLQPEAQPLTVTATLSPWPNQTVNVAIVDSAGVFEPSPVIRTQTGSSSVQAQITPRKDLAVGDYSGTLQIKLCFDAPTTCASPLPGSPFALPYKFSIVQPPAGMAFPDKLVLTTDEDEVPLLPLRVEPETLTGNYHLKVVDNHQVFQFTAKPILMSGTLDWGLGLNPALKAGTYSGDLELHYCIDEACSAQRPGSPIKVPYSITLRASGNLKPLQRWAGIDEWTQHQGSAAHTGYVPVTLNPLDFSKRWRWSLPNPAYSYYAELSVPDIHPIVTLRGKLFVAPEGSTRLYALAESDRSELWSAEANAPNGAIEYLVNAPVATNDAVFAPYSKRWGNYETGVTGFNSETGIIRQRQVFFAARQEMLTGLAVSNGQFLTSQSGSLYHFDSTGSVVSQHGIFGSSGWRPAIDGQNVYTISGVSSLSVYDARAGVEPFHINTPGEGVPLDDLMPMVIGSNQVVGLNTHPAGSFQPNHVGTLTRYDIGTRGVRWSVEGPFVGKPAYAKGVIYVMGRAQVEARNADDGAVLWAWKPDERTEYPFLDLSADANVIVTDNLLFVSSVTSTYAVDLATRKTVWSYPRSGVLAMSPNGILYIVVKGTRQRGLPDEPILNAGVHAINLR